MVSPGEVFVVAGVESGGPEGTAQLVVPRGTELWTFAAYILYPRILSTKSWQCISLTFIKLGIWGLVYLSSM